MKKIYDLGKGIFNLFKSNKNKVKKFKPKPVRNESKQIQDLRKNRTNTNLVKKKNTNVKKQSTELKKTRVNNNKNKKKNTNLRDLAIGTGIALTGTAANKYFSDDATSSVKNKKKIPKKKFGMGQVDDLSKGKARQGPPKPVAKAPVKKKKSKSNISNSSSYDADFTKKNLEKRGLNPKGRMSKENMAKTTAAKDKKIAKGMDFGQKKKKVKAPMYESMGTMGGVKKTKYASKGMKTSKYYASGGVVFSGR